MGNKYLKKSRQYAQMAEAERRNLEDYKHLSGRDGVKIGKTKLELAVTKLTDTFSTLSEVFESRSKLPEELLNPLIDKNLEGAEQAISGLKEWAKIRGEDGTFSTHEEERRLLNQAHECAYLAKENLKL